MKTYHVHIKGIVQGVGFRPYIYRTAEERGIRGWVSNAKDGVHIEFSATEAMAHQFCDLIRQSPPPNAVITSFSIREVAPCSFSSFTIETGMTDTKPDLLITPDFAICESCRNEIKDHLNRRHQYPFTTCLHCGPRYSIVNELPYERHNTTMAVLSMCTDCAAEYYNVHDSRHYSQTSSCPSCAIAMHMYNTAGQLLCSDTPGILYILGKLLTEGSIIAVKGIGGYLLLCDASNEVSVRNLRQRKQRPAKPFALLYSDIDAAKKNVRISAAEETALVSRAGPIVLCGLLPAVQHSICTDLIAPGLDKMGVMLPCSPLLQLIASKFGNPLIATSANLSSSPIIYNDQEALDKLHGIADYVVSYDRDIVVPQDDSVMQVTGGGKEVIIRRSRGLAPNYFPNPFGKKDTCILAMGGELKSAFALQDQHQLYISQYLGNQESLASQEAFTHTLQHLLTLLQAKPSVILADKHPGYFVSQQAIEIASKENIPLVTIQHHEAHVGAVLAENNLLDEDLAVLGVAWDGTGYGYDKQIWGGEFFLYENYTMKRVAHLDYFPLLLGDKMSREPRLSALSLLHSMPAKQELIRQRFTPQEWQYYRQLANQPATLHTSSVGRWLDGIASLLGICQMNTYEGEAAMKLEAAARSCQQPVSGYYHTVLRNNRLDCSLLLQELLTDLARKEATGLMAKKVFYSLAMAIGNVSDHFGIGKIAFSGGVFQNALLVDMITELLGNRKQLFWHRQLSPNDECIGFGQLACYHNRQKQQSALHRETVVYEPVHYV